MESRYAAGAALQLVSLCRARESHRRDLDAVAWALWCERYPVTPRVRSFFLQLIERWEGPIGRVLAAMDAAANADDSSGDDEPLYDPLHEEAKQRARGVLKRVKRQLGSERFPTFLLMSYELLLGRFEQAARYDDADFELWLDGLVAFSPAKDREVLRRDWTHKMIRELPEFCSLITVRDALERVSDAQLEGLRDQVQAGHDWFLSLSNRTPQPVPHLLVLAGFVVRYGSPAMRELIDETLARPEFPAEWERFKTRLEGIRRNARSSLASSLTRVDPV